MSAAKNRGSFFPKRLIAEFAHERLRFFRRSTRDRTRARFDGLSLLRVAAIWR